MCECVCVLAVWLSFRWGQRSDVAQLNSYLSAGEHDPLAEQMQFLFRFYYWPDNMLLFWSFSGSDVISDQK